MFSYHGDYSIKSAVPLAEIEQYLSALGALRLENGHYRYNERLLIRIEPGENPVLKNLGVPCNTITAVGDAAAAEAFLNSYRIKFMSAGG